MVRVIILLCLLMPSLYSAEFTASVSHNQAILGESLTLSLTLKGASAKESPSFNELKKTFFIHSQTQSSNTSIINGRAASNIVWSVALTPQKEGEAIIPSISIETTEGILSSQPITLNVVKDKENSGAHANNLILTSSLSHARPYKNEPFVYTLTLTSTETLANIQMQKFNLEDAVLDANGESKVYEKIVDGVRVGVLEVSFVITPLKAGPLKITLYFFSRGDCDEKKSAIQLFFFDDDFGFPLMQGFNRLKPFTVVSEETIIDVQPAIAGMSPWLPARSLKIEEIWNEPALQVGEPFTRAFKITAIGMKSTQLPHLNDLQIDNGPFKIYADKPEIGEEIKGGVIESFRKEQYTLIPQQAGDLILPEILVAWWDTLKNERSIAKIPARMLHVKPAAHPPVNQSTPEVVETKTELKEMDPLFYVIIAAMAVFLFAAILWGLSLKRKISCLTEKPTVSSQPVIIKKKPVKDKKEKLPDLNPT